MRRLQPERNHQRYGAQIIMGRLSEMPNIGAMLENLLIDAGIGSPDTLIRLGSKAAFTEIRKVDNTACFSKLCALEGALQGQRWHNLSPEIKTDLKCFFEALKKQK